MNSKEAKRLRRLVRAGGETERSVEYRQIVRTDPYTQQRKLAEIRAAPDSPRGLYRRLKHHVQANRGKQ